MLWRGTDTYQIQKVSSNFANHFCINSITSVLICKTGTLMRLETGREALKKHRLLYGCSTEPSLAVVTKIWGKLFLRHAW